GMRPLAGRSFAPEEDQPGRELVAILSHKLWVRRFGARPIVGTSIHMNGRDHAVVGVMPAAFDLASNDEELWTPIAFTPERKAMHDEHYLTVYGRLKRGVSREQALQQLEAVAARLRHDIPRDAAELRFSMESFGDNFVGSYRSRLRSRSGSRSRRASSAVSRRRCASRAARCRPACARADADPPAADSAIACAPG